MICPAEEAVSRRMQVVSLADLFRLKRRCRGISGKIRCPHAPGFPVDVLIPVCFPQLEIVDTNFEAPYCNRELSLALVVKIGSQRREQVLGHHVQRAIANVVVEQDVHRPAHDALVRGR